MRRKSEERREFQLTEDHIRRGRRNDPQRTPLALLENGLAVNPAVRPTSTVELDNQRRKLRTYMHAPPLSRWLNEWNKGSDMGPLDLSMDTVSRRISTRRRNGKDQGPEGETRPAARGEPSPAQRQPRLDWRRTTTHAAETGTEGEIFRATMNSNVVGAIHLQLGRHPGWPEVWHISARCGGTRKEAVCQSGVEPEPVMERLEVFAERWALAGTMPNTL